MTTPERWRRSREVFDGAADLPPGPERDGFLARACAGDASLRAEVEALLAADAATTSVLERSPAGFADVLADVARVPPTTLRVGPYRIVGELGQGGMGVVYLAEREDVGTRVALKLVRGGAAAPEYVARFLVERRVLGRLEHPYIAHLLDAGVMDDGTPWFAMPYVEGEPIDRFCDAHGLGIRERLSLFEKVCEAVQYAHANLVVHRDLKPSNILVAADGTPRLLDFGIAKLLETDGVETGLTGTGLRLMTPEYASPEQIRGAPVTTATDVYALGVVLYELLCGQPPYPRRGRTLGEMERAVLETDPLRPSAAVLRTIAAPDDADRRTPEAAARARGTLPDRLRRELGGDLDTIVLRALEKDPARRYPSAEALRDDLQRRRTGLPVLARPQTPAYRARRFVQRHRFGVAAAAALAILLLGFGVTLARQQAETARALVLAEERRGEAEMEAETAGRVTDFLVQLFSASDPEQARGEEVTARELLESGVERIDALDDQPAVQARLLDVVGRVHRNLGYYDQTLALHTRALALRRQLHPEPHPDVAASLNELGIILEITAQLDSALVVHREALEMRRARFGGEHLDVAQSMNSLSVLLRRMGRLDEAEPLLLESLALSRRLDGTEGRMTLASLNNLGVLRGVQGRHAEAEAAYREIVDVERRAGTSPSLGRTLQNLGSAIGEQGRNAEAEAVLREALDVKLAVHPRDHPSVSTTLQALAVMASRRGDHAAAETMIREALAIREARFGVDHPRTAATRSALAEIIAAPR
jgi:eukaryotic-like serine/threonine-protein kinase